MLSYINLTNLRFYDSFYISLPCCLIGLLMRRKIFMLIFVPVILILGGTLAYSGWSGSAVSSFSQSTAVVSYTESLTFTATNANLTPLIIGNGTTNTTVLFSTPQFVVSLASGSAVGFANVYANVSNMVPGDWVEFNVTITNTGTAILFAGDPHFSNESNTNIPPSLGLLRPGHLLSYTVYMNMPIDSPPLFAGTTQLFSVSIPLSVIQ